MRTSILMVSAILAVFMVGCGGSSDEGTSGSSSPLALPKVTTEAEALEAADCIWVCKQTGHMPNGVGVVQVEGASVMPQPSAEVLSRCDKIFPCSALKNGNH
ncbi:MAG TPA: hypothetical protein VFC25_06310 [Verrucomicrobiae bacterium]|nr:hypothetical protein [Verrucomicrobiae bacterium]